MAEVPGSRLAALHAEAASLLAAEGAPRPRFGASPVRRALRSGVGRRGAASTPRARRSRAAHQRSRSPICAARCPSPRAESRLEVLVELGRAERLLPEAHEFTALREASSSRATRRRAEIALELAVALSGSCRATEAAVVLEEALEHGCLSAGTVELLETALIGGGLDELSATPALLGRAARHFERADVVRSVIRGCSRRSRSSVSWRDAGARLCVPGAARDCGSSAARVWLDYGYVTAACALCDERPARRGGWSARCRDRRGSTSRSRADVHAVGCSAWRERLASGDLDVAEVFARDALTGS